MKNKKITRLDYCQCLMVSQTNYTLTYYADHHPEGIFHDKINHYLSGEKLQPKLVWEQAKGNIQQDKESYLIFDDTILDKNHSHKIELVNKQYSGNAKRLIKGIGLVNCIYVNPKTKQYWIIDYRIYNKSNDGKSKLDHAKEMLKNATEHKKLAYKYVLMDTWYATKELMLYIDNLNKIFYCPLKSNRLVDDSGGIRKYTAVKNLQWSESEEKNGKLIKIHKFPKDYKVQLFRVAVTENRTDWIVTNDTTQDSRDDVQEVCAIRWKVEQFHREIKQLTGIEKNQCRKARIQRNHVACCVLVWLSFNRLAMRLGKTMYQLKQGLLDEYLCTQLRSPEYKD